jgi:hypothetical protein
VVGDDDGAARTGGALAAVPAAAAGEEEAAETGVPGDTAEIPAAVVKPELELEGTPPLLPLPLLLTPLLAEPAGSADTRGEPGDMARTSEGENSACDVGLSDGEGPEGGMGRPGGVGCGG